MYGDRANAHATAMGGSILMGQPGSRPSQASGYGRVPYAEPRGADDPSALRRAPADHARPRTTSEEAAFVDEQHRQRVWAGLRNEAVHRLVGMNIRHAMHAWTARRDRAVAPWAVGFLYANPTGTVYDGIELYAVAAATRLVDHDDDLPGPAHLLYRLADIAHARHRNEYGWLDPTTLCTYRDRVHAPATYIGTVLSCLGDRREPWESLRRGDSDDIPGHVYALLTDNTAMLISRAGRRDLRRVVIHASGELTYQRDLTGRRWIGYPEAAVIPECDPDVWEQLHRLHSMAGRQSPLPTLEPSQRLDA